MQRKRMSFRFITRGPFDRLLIAQASVEKMWILTAHRHFEKYAVDVGAEDSRSFELGYSGPTQKSRLAGRLICSVETSYPLPAGSDDPRSGGGFKGLVVASAIDRRHFRAHRP